MIGQVTQGDCLEVMKRIPDGSVDMVLCDFAVRNDGRGVNPARANSKLSRVIKHTGYPRQVLDFGNPNSEVLHPTQKPVALFEYLIRTYTNPGDTVLDNCCGSGTTGVACLNTDRRSIQIELSEEYCQVARRRLETAANERFLKEMM